MNNPKDIEHLQHQLTGLSPSRRVGRVVQVQGGTLKVAGLNDVARIGDRVEIRRRTGGAVSGEILQLLGDGQIVLADGPLDGIALDDRVCLSHEARIFPCDAWIGRIVDPDGQPLDGRPLSRGGRPRALLADPPPPARRRPLGPRLETGLAVFNTMLPVVSGQRVGLFAGSGVGKSNLLGQLAQNVQADVVVIALIGERGRELRHFVDQVMGPAGLARAVVVAATSDRSPLLRRRCAWTAMSIAEHFRDAGKSVLLLADSITRFAEAHREVAVAAGEAPVLRGFPPSTSHLIMSLCERAGPGTGDQGDITALFSVLVAGSDMEEPIADILRGVLDGHVVLDRTIAERGRYPAIDLLRSVSRSLPDAATASENDLIADARRTLGTYGRNEMMITAGLYGHGSDPEIDRSIQLWPDLDGFLGEFETKGIPHSFSRLARILSRAPTRKRRSAPHPAPGRNDLAPG